MRSHRNIAVVALCLGLAGLLAYAELVLDWRTPEGDRTVQFALTSNAAFLMADADRLQSEMKTKYGERVSVTVPVTGHPKAETGVAQVSLDGTLVETHSLRKLSRVYGLFVVDPNDPDPIRFPFELDPEQNLQTINRSVVKELTDHFKRVPQTWFAFTDADWSIARCNSVKSGLGLGLIGGLLRLQEGTFCVVTWKGKRAGSMLVFVGRADGKAWLQPFTERVCRNITENGLAQLSAEVAERPDYAACILGNQTTDTGPGMSSLFGSVFLVGQYRLERIGRIGKRTWL
jgi:hypothetical protein